MSRDAINLMFASMGLAAGLPAGEIAQALGTSKRSSGERWSLEWFGDGRNQKARYQDAYAIDAYSDGTFTVSTWPGDGLTIHEGRARKGRQGINHAKNAAEVWLSQNRDRLVTFADEANAREVGR